MKKSKEIAFGGMMAALAVVIMCFGGMIPFMTYVSPVIAMIIGAVVLKIISKAGFFTWYFAVAILAVLLSPDKEAASVFIAFGCYPAVRMIFEKSPFRWLLKFIYFNIVIFIEKVNEIINLRMGSKYYFIVVFFCFFNQFSVIYK